MLSIPRYTGWEPPRMTSAGLSTASHLLPLEKGVLEEVKGLQNTLCRAFHWRAWHPAGYYVHSLHSLGSILV